MSLIACLITIGRTASIDNLCLARSVIDHLQWFLNLNMSAAVPLGQYCCQGYRPTGNLKMIILMRIHHGHTMPALSTAARIVHELFGNFRFR